MRVRYFFCSLFVLSLLISSVYATDFDSSSSSAESSEPVVFETIPTVSLDPESVASILDGIGSLLESDSSEPVDSITPEFALSQDSIEAISDSIASVLSPDVDLQPLSVPSGSAISGGYYVTVDCVLGNGLTFYVPSDFRVDSIAFDGDNLINLSNSSIYLLPVDSRFSSYTIYAPRFGHFQYRQTAGSYSDLRISRVIDTNVSILSDSPYSLPVSNYYLLILGFLFLLFIIILLRR